MSFENFKKRVYAIIRKAGGKISVGFYNDKQNGRYFANCSDGVRIIGSASNLRIQVRWGSGHTGMAELPELA